MKSDRQSRLLLALLRGGRFLALGSLLALGLALGGCRRDGLVDFLSENEERGVRRAVSGELERGFSHGGLGEERVRACLTNAYEKARKRVAANANSGVIPFYFTLSDMNIAKEYARDAKGPQLAGNRFVGRFALRLWGAGERASWCDAPRSRGGGKDDFWFLLERFDPIKGGVEVFASPLANLETGTGSSWFGDKSGDRGGYGMVHYRCADLLLGVEGRDDGSWIAQVANGSSRLSLVLGDARLFDIRIGRTLLATSAWEATASKLRDLGLLVETVPVAVGDGTVFLECR